jgi:hypothetical protein
LIRKPEGEGHLGRQRHQWEGSIKVGFKNKGWERGGWIHLDQDMYQPPLNLVNTEMNAWIS